MNEQKKHDKLTNEEVEYRIAKAVVKNVPDLYEEAANTPVTPLAMVDDILGSIPDKNASYLAWQLPACCWYCLAVPSLPIPGFP